MAWTRGAWALPLRLIFGFGMMFHSFPKLFSTEGHANFVGKTHSSNEVVLIHRAV